jgi:osmotically-inducible protein OsmY
MRIFLALIVGVMIGAAGLWIYTTHNGQAHLEAAGDTIGNAAKSAGDAIQQKLHAMNLNADTIKEELARTGRVLRTKAGQAGEAIADRTADARITAAIKTKLLASRELSSLAISVNTTDGVVTLSGTVGSAEQVGKAMMIALDTEGAHQVISTLQVKR